jgi:hypothetical protein
MSSNFYSSFKTPNTQQRSTIKPIAPALKQQHTQEQNVLNDCNEKLNKFVERVIELENEKNKLKDEINKVKESWGEETRFVRKENEPKLENSRTIADDYASDAAKAVAKVNRQDAELYFLQKIIADELKASAADSEKIDNLQKTQKQNEHELLYFKKSIIETEEELDKQAKNNVKLKNDLVGLLNTFEEQTSECIKLRCQNQTIEEQIPFLKAVHELELTEMKRLFERRRVDPADFYRSELKRAISDIRNDFKELNDNEKRELEAWYKVKTDQLQQLEDKRYLKDDLYKIRYLNRNLLDTISNNQQEFNELLKIRKDLEDKLKNLEEKLKNLRIEHADTLKNQDLLINELKDKIQEHLNDYDHLLSNMSILQFEINAFKRLIECNDLPKQESKPDANLTGEELMRRLQREKAKIGDVHVSIAWDNVNDLDLHVIEPSGEEINFSHRKSETGGELDIDMNAGAQRSLEPVENIYWPNGKAPPGRYKILVVYYSNHGSPDPTNYLVLAELNGKPLEFRGKMNYGDKPHVYEFEI